MPTTTKAKRKGARRRSSRGLSLRVAAKEYIWLWDNLHGMSAEKIAARTGRSLRRVQLGLERALAQQQKGDVEYGQDGAGGSSTGALRSLWLIPMFPLGPYTPQATCAHFGPIRSGSFFCCMVCHQSGVDGHPALQRDPSTDPSPEPKPAPPPPETALETRKQRRARQFPRESLVIG
jgi:hypothetical protein